MSTLSRDEPLGGLFTVFSRSNLSILFPEVSAKLSQFDYPDPPVNPNGSLVSPNHQRWQEYKQKQERALSRLQDYINEKNRENSLEEMNMQASNKMSTAGIRPRSQESGWHKDDLRHEKLKKRKEALWHLQ